MGVILFVEDDHNLGQLLKESLERNGHRVEWRSDGAGGLDAFKTGQYDLCILDAMLPLKDGFMLAEEIKAMDPRVPVIFLTARFMDKDKIRGFEIGCDDYITKPFNVTELHMRIRAVLKRSALSADNPPAKVTIGLFEFDPIQMTLKKGADVKKLSSKEVDLLHILFQNRNQFVARSVILEKVWGNDSPFSAKSMNVYLTKLRKLLKDDPGIEILNSYGVGFKLVLH